ncbi:MAG: recombinase zinc beta ribbon domain-containing protein [Ruthenibacterium lactatiformans]
MRPYIGNTIHYRETNISYKNKKRIRKPQSEWMRVEGTQEAIISKEDFERVQQQIASRRRKQKNATTQMFAGLVRCADCGWSMKCATNRSNKTPFIYFTCTYYAQHGVGWCSNHYIRYDVLYAYVLSRLQYWSKQVQLDSSQLIHDLQKNLGSEQAAEIRTDAKRTGSS